MNRLASELFVLFVLALSFMYFDTENECKTIPNSVCLLCKLESGNKTFCWVSTNQSFCNRTGIYDCVTSDVINYTYCRIF